VKGLRRAWQLRSSSPIDPASGLPRTPSPMPPGDANASARRSGIARGIATNLLNPPVILFYMTFLPQFIGPGDAFLPRFVVLAATHVGMSLLWLSVYAATLGVLAERMGRPVVRLALEGATGLLLVGFGIRLLVR